MEKKRKLIGVYVSNLEDDFTNALCKGVMAAAEDYDVNLVIFPGKYLGIDYGYDPGQKYEYQYNTLFSYAMEGSFDGLLLCIGTFGYMLSAEQVLDFVKQFKELPLITVASHVAGYPSIQYDNRTGLREAIRFLIQTQGKTKIGMVSGPLGNADGLERYQVYKDTLLENGIEPLESRIVFGNFTRRCTPAIESLLDQNKDLEAIVCANDDSALGVYAVLNSRGIEIGKDILVIGFDDIPSAAKLDPPLATVRAEASVLGYRSVEQILTLIAGQHFDRATIATTFLYRASAGMLTKSEQQKINRNLSIPGHQELYAHSFMPDEILRDKFISLNHTTNILSRDMLTLVDDSEQNYAMLLSNLHMLDIKSSYLYVIPQPMINRNHGDWERPGVILLKAYQSGRNTYSVPRINQKLPINKLFTHDYIDRKNRFSLVLCDLFSHEKQYGLFLCDIKHEYFHYTELLTYQLSAAITMINLFQVQKKILSELERRNETLLNNNIRLDTISKRDELTGMLNRRGFFQEAEKRLSEKEIRDKYIMIFYADTNRLKIINDTYGHEEGDYTLTVCAKILTASFPKDSIIGRIGGDEFAGMSLSDKHGNIAKLQSRIAAETHNLNRFSGKPYQISLSVGICEYPYSPDLQIEDLLDQADDLLYTEKRRR